MADTEARWYVAHTYSGYENKVKADIENTIVNRNLQDQILEVYVPMQEVEREGKDSKKLVQQKMFPAYVLIKMFMNDDTWYVVRNEEVASMGLMSSVAEAPFSIGDSVIVTSGIWEDTVGIVRQIDLKNKTVTINIDMFGRETPTELSFNDVKVCD